MRNYICKEWFRDIAFGGEPEQTTMGGRVEDILKEYVNEAGIAEPGKSMLVNGNLVQS